MTSQIYNPRVLDSNLPVHKNKSYTSAKIMIELMKLRENLTELLNLTKLNFLFFSAGSKKIENGNIMVMVANAVP